MRKTILAIALALAYGHTTAQNSETLAQRQLNQGGVTAAHARGLSGQGIRIGVIDQGFDLTHRDLLGRVVASRNFYSGPTVTWGTHGTAMASVAAANPNSIGTVGVAPMAQLLLAQVGPGGTSSVLRENSVFAALDWLSAQRTTVINLSFGAAYTSDFTKSIQRSSVTGIYFSPSAYGVNYGAASTVINNYKLATDRGSILVAAAGNQGLAYSEFPGMYATRTNANGSLVLGGRMIIVGAVDSNNVMASFSDRAGHICQNSVGLNCRDPYLTRDFYVVAPGVNVVVSQPNQQTGGKNLATTMSGTSPAAAYVSGGMALMRQAWPLLKPEQLVALVLTTTRDLGAPGTDNVYGRGLVDFDRATQPQGSLRVASAMIKPSTSLTGGVVLAQTRAVGNGLVRTLNSSSVLQQTQVIDSYGRNYSADLTRLIVPGSITYNPLSPYLGYVGVMSQSINLSSDTIMRVMPGTSGLGAELSRQHGRLGMDYQVGYLNEVNGFLGNYGQGAMGLGKSSTVFNQVGIRFNVADSMDLFANFAQGITYVNNDAASMIRLSDTIRTSTGRIGITKTDLLKYQDRLSVSVGTPILIRQGSAEITGVVGYNYDEDTDGTVTARPIMATDKVNLRSQREYMVGVNYAVPIGPNAAMLVQLAHSTTGYNYGINWVTRY